MRSRWLLGRDIFASCALRVHWPIAVFGTTVEVKASRAILSEKPVIGANQEAVAGFWILLDLSRFTRSVAINWHDIDGVRNDRVLGVWRRNRGRSSASGRASWSCS